MSLSRSSASLAIIRSLSRSTAPQFSKICFECLVHPASCQISSIAAASANLGQSLPAARWQSTATTSRYPIEDKTSTSPVLPEAVAAEPFSEPAEDAVATTAASSSTSPTSLPVVRKDRSKADLPSLDDLEALRPRKFRVPAESEPADSPAIGLYTRKFKRLSSRVGKAFNLDQLYHLARTAGIADRSTNLRKAELIQRVMTRHWGLTDPAEYAIRETEGKEAQSGVDQSTVEDVPVSEKELFFLLSKGRHPSLLQRLSSNSRVRASIRGTSPAVLQLQGPPRDVAAVRKEWTRLKGEISTEVLESGIPKALRSDICTSLSHATDAFVSPKATKIEVSYRSGQKTSLRLVEACLRQLRLQTAIISESPRFGLLDPQADDNIFLPIVPQNSLPWNLSTLPPLGLTRYTSMSPVHGARPIFRAGSVPTETTFEEIQKTLLEPLEAAPGTASFRACFGHLLRLNTKGSSQLLSQTTQGEWSAKPDSVFVPATPEGTANRYVLNLRRYDSRLLTEHTEDLKVSTRRIRRLMYISSNVSMPLKYLRFERVMPSEHAAAPRAPMESTDNRADTSWTGEHGQNSYAHVSMPHSMVDLRLEASKSEPVSSDLLDSIASVVNNAAPEALTWNDEVYRIVQDDRIRETTFASGLPEPYASRLDVLQPVLERRDDLLLPGHKRSTAFELRGTSTEAATASVLQMLQEL